MYLLASESWWEEGRQYSFEDSLKDCKNYTITFFSSPKKCYANTPYIKEDPEGQLLGAVSQVQKSS